MNTDAQSIWPENPHEEIMMAPVSAGDDDFTNFLDLDLDFPDFGDVQGQHGSMDTSMDGYNMNLNQQEVVMDQGVDMQFNPHDQDVYGSNDAQQPIRSIQQMQHQHQGQPQLYQQAQPQYHRPQPIIPPTPSSGDLLGGVAAYYNPGSGHIIYEHYQGKDDQMSFTPLVSPAVTPADASFHLPDYAIPGEYFSPLASPAIEAQKSQYRFWHGQRGAETVDSTSPAVVSTEVGGASAPVTPAVQKHRRKQSQGSRSAGRSIRQSPIVKAQSKRKQHSLTLKSNTVAEIAESHHMEVPKTQSDKLGGNSSSGQDSVSPEALAEALMPPPAVPHSASKSPCVAAQRGSPFLQGNEPATPATLMRLNKSQSPMKTNQPREIEATSGDVMEDIMLPEPARKIRPAVPPIQTSAVLDERSTPKLLAQNLKSKAPGSGAVSAASTPTAPTPLSKGPASPEGTELKKVKSAGRLAKKRQSVSSSQVSPAIRPKISPNIKPLMPGGSNASVSAEHSALYLASKSNYQNILDGTHLPGVTYPEALAENLSSKRTSHKIAEQGRRNRINTALKEIESLLPPTPTLLALSKKEFPSSPDEDPTEKNAQANQPTSKANTVEMAIMYIKSLQTELSETRIKLEAAERKLAEGNGDSSQRSASD